MIKGLTDDFNNTDWVPKEKIDTIEAKHQAKIEYYHEENDKLRKTLRNIDASVALKCKYGREAKAKPQ